MSSSAPPPVNLLNPDVLREVFLRLSKYDLLDAVCVCREWNHIAQRLIDQRLEIVASLKTQEANLHLFQRLQQSESLKHQVAQHIVVKEWHVDWMPLTQKAFRLIEDPWASGRYFSTTYIDQEKPPPEAKTLTTELGCALQRLKLASFTWSALHPAPAAILEQLASRPSCDVHIRLHDRAYEAAAWTYSMTLNHTRMKATSQLKLQLSTLEVLLPPDDNVLLLALGSMIASTSRLKRLKVYSLGKLWAGPKVPPDMRVGRGYVFTPIRSLEWLREPLAENGKMLHLQELELDNFCVCGTEGFCLGEMIDLPSLQRVGISCFSLFAGGVVCPNLRSFRLHCYNPEGELDRFCSSDWEFDDVRVMLSRCDSLAELDLVDGGEIIDEQLLEQIGSCLVRLSLHKSTSLISDTGLDLDIVAKYCQNLAEISLDAHSEDFLPFCAKVAAAFPRSTDLTFSRDVEDSIIVDPSKGPVSRHYTTTLSDMPEIWKRLSTENPHISQITIRFIPDKPWDRDKRFFTTATPYGILDREARRTLVARRSLVRLGGVAEKIEATCLDVEEAERAIKHQWQWLQRGVLDREDWTSRLEKTRRMAIEGRNLVVREGVDSAGASTQQVM